MGMCLPERGEDSDKTVGILGLVLAISARRCDKYKNFLRWPTCVCTLNKESFKMTCISSLLGLNIVDVIFADVGVTETNVS